MAKEDRKNEILEIDAFLELTKKTRSKGTFYQYTVTFNQFYEWLNGNAPTLGRAEEFIKYLESRGLAPNTVHRHYAAIRMCAQESNLQLRVRVPVKRTRLPTWLEPDEVKRYLNSAYAFAKNTPNHEWVYPIMVIYISGGFRANELIRMMKGQLFPDGRIRVMRKRDHETIVPIPNGDFKILWQFAHMDEPHTEIDRVFPHATYSETRLAVKAITKMAGIKKDMRIHSLRHTCGTRLAYAGMSTEDIAEVLGDTLEVARIYTHIASAHLKKQMPDISFLRDLPDD